MNHNEGQTTKKLNRHPVHKAVNADDTVSDATPIRPKRHAVAREPRLQFTHEEQTNPKLKRHIRRAMNAARKADKAQSRIPKQTLQFDTPLIDPATGQSSVYTYTQTATVDKKLPRVKRHRAAKAAMGGMHREISKYEDDNMGLQAAHRTEETIESGAKLLRNGYVQHKLKPYRKAVRAERKLEKANLEALYRKSMQAEPEKFSNPFSRRMQKRAIKKRYIEARRKAHAADAAQQASFTVVRTTKRFGRFLVRHSKMSMLIAGIAAMIAVLLCIISSCTVLVQGGISAVTGSTFPSTDEEMLGAESAYAAKENDLQAKLDAYESSHEYDEYQFMLDEIKHDPYVLISILTAKHERSWTLSDVSHTLDEIFSKQYLLTEDVKKEVRYKTEMKTGHRVIVDPDTGSEKIESYEYEAKVPYDYTICTVTLKNTDLSHLPPYLLTEAQMEMYATYLSTHGNRPDLFPQPEFPNVSEKGDYVDYDVPPEALEDERFAAMITEAEKYLGLPYVWGGSSPATSFDCSGYVSWVINHSGWNVGRLSAQGLYGICTPVSATNARPGDLVFFKGTYNTSGVSHVGIYVGNSMMIHCGDPISYTNLNTNYWQKHLYTYGRLP